MQVDIQVGGDQVCVECRWTYKWVVIRCAWSAGGHTSGW